MRRRPAEKPSSRVVMLARFMLAISRMLDPLEHCDNWELPTRWLEWVAGV